ncbi:MAG TPA: response regulator [Bryobacteraceae bacterium]|nr:response regulator [Bryobacteraceae bacterium]
MIRVLIADDEAPARRRLRRLLSAHPVIDICGEAATGVEALALVAGLKPQALFLDIEMPGATGIEVAASLPSPAPRIIFVTAYDQYAVDAFRLNALDYLLKPIEPARLAESIDRLRRESPPPSLLRVERLIVSSGDRCLVVEATEIECFTSEAGQTHLWGHRRDGTAFDYYIGLTLNELEARLDQAAFIRVSRASLLRVAAIEWAHPAESSGGEVKLRGGLILPVSRRRWAAMMRALGRAGPASRPPGQPDTPHAVAGRRTP